MDTEESSTIPLIALFDNEEIGSSTRQGALSDFLCSVTRRIMLSLGMDDEDMMIAQAKSFMLSADNGHAVHPNYAEKADITSRPRLNGGVLLKYSGNMKYTTDGKSGSFIRALSVSSRSSVSSGESSPRISVRASISPVRLPVL